MGKVEQIKKSIEKAERLESKLDDECFKIGGYTSPKIRHLLNNLGEMLSEKDNYLEVGSHRGSTFISALFGNKFNATSIDNWSEFNEDGTVREDFMNNIKQFGDRVEFFEQDCFTILLPENKYDLYLYDGAHSYEEQKLGVTYFYPTMKDEFILCVDDCNWEQVSRGTQDGIKEMGLTILFEQHLIDGYHNGFYVALLKK